MPSDDLWGPDAAEAFGRIFDEHYAGIRRYLARRIGEHTADDLAAETFLVAYRDRHRYDPARGPVRPWLFGIATNLLRQHWRQEARGYHDNAREDTAREQATDSHDSQVARRVDAERDARLLAAALVRLAPGDRDVLLLSCWGGLDGNEIAAALDIPPGTVRSRLHRARNWLRANVPTTDEENRHA